MLGERGGIPVRLISMAAGGDAAQAQWKGVSPIVALRYFGTPDLSGRFYVGLAHSQSPRVSGHACACCRVWTSDVNTSRANTLSAPKSVPRACRSDRSRDRS